jgi:hypothetical protein
MAADHVFARCVEIYFHQPYVLLILQTFDAFVVWCWTGDVTTSLCPTTWFWSCYITCRQSQTSSHISTTVIVIRTKKKGKTKLNFILACNGLLKYTYIWPAHGLFNSINLLNTECGWTHHEIFFMNILLLNFQSLIKHIPVLLATQQALTNATNLHHLFTLGLFCLCYIFRWSGPSSCSYN